MSVRGRFLIICFVSKFGGFISFVQNIPSIICCKSGQASSNIDAVYLHATFLGFLVDIY